MDQIVVFLPNRGFFGASLVVVPALLAIRERFPGLPVVGLSTSPAHGCFRSWGVIEEFHHYTKPLRGGLRAPVVRSLRGKARLVVNMRPGAEWVQLWSWLVPAPERWAFRQGFGRVIAKHHVAFDVSRYKAFNYLALLPGDPGVRRGDLLAGWPFGQAAAPLPGKRLVVLPSGGGGGKLWPLESYEAVIRAWVAGMGDGATVIAGPREQRVIAWFAERRLGDLPGVVLDSTSPLIDQVATIRAAAAVLHNDCGPGHLAQMADVPRVTVFPDWGDQGEWYRPGPRARCVQAAKGSPIESVPPEAVLAALREVVA
jgi:ADP-heptose:LPS heptosyltransferase